MRRVVNLQKLVRIGKLFRMRRIACGLSLNQVERSTGIPAFTINQIELGNNRNPGFLDILELGKLFNLSVDDLLNENIKDLEITDGKERISKIVDMLKDQATDDQLEPVITFLLAYLKRLARGS